MTAGSFQQLLDSAWNTHVEGNLDHCLEILDEALAFAKAEEKQDWVDQALCNRAAILTEMGQGETSRPELRAILLRSRESRNQFLAAYHLSRSYEIDGNQDRAAFYSRLALGHAQVVDEPRLLASCHDQLGRLLLAISDFPAAQSELEKALALVESAAETPEQRLTSPLRRAIVLDNLGYCYIVQGRMRRGFRALFESLRIVRRLKTPSYEIGPRISLAFAYTQIGRFNQAIRHGSRGRELAESCGWQSDLKYALFVLGEAEKLSGNPLAARRIFVQLQEEFYPDAPQVPDMLLLMNVQRLINIKA